MDSVQCAECGERYDSDEHPFCPRCGALEKAEASEAPFVMAARDDPRRRRVQAAGVMMTLVGGLMLVLFLVMLAMAPSLVPQTLDTLADQPGGAVHIHLSEGGAPVHGAEVTLSARNGTLLQNGTTDQNGWANFTAVGPAGIDLAVHHAGNVWTRAVFSLPGAGTDASATVVELDLAVAPRTSEDWMGVDAFVTGSRVIAAVFSLVSAVTVAGGVSALRLRRRSLATAGALVGMLPWLILFVASLNGLVLAVLLFFALALWFLRQGRALFQD